MNLCDAWFKEVKDLLDDGKINSSAQLNKESEEVE
jgi:hypothetical protein